jgi:hypothetical protein
MAGSILIPLKTVFDNKGLKQAQSEFSKIGGSLKGILGAAGIGLGLASITTALKDSTKAAVEDVKSQALLAQQLRNTVGANEGQIASVEKSISTMMMQASVADDVIRPAFAALVRATGDVGQATKLTSLALDVAAGTGKDLGTVSLALGKAVNGSTTSLLKLVPSIKGASDPMGELAKQFNGAAAAASNSDPIQAITIIMGELQEQIGKYLLPALKDLATYLKSSEFAGAVDSAFIGFDKIFGAVDSLISRIPVLGDAMNGLGAQLANGEWTKFIPIVGSWIELLNNSNPKRSANAQSSRMTGQALAYQASLKLSPSKSPVVATATSTKGLSAAQKKAEADAKAAADKAAKARQAIIDAFKKAADEAKKAFDDLKSSIDDFNKSFDATAQGFNAVFKLTPILGAFEQQAVDAFDTIKQSAQDAFDSKLITKDALASLTAYADREKALLQSIAKQRDVLAKKISIAQAITSGVMGSLNITSLLQSETRTVTQSVTKMVDGIALTTTKTFDEVISGGLADSFKKLVDKTKTFASNLTKLKALGLNGTLFKQIVDAGAEAGNATAESIISGGASAVTELNGLFTDLATTGEDIAKTSTDVFYGIGEDVTNGFIEGLRSQDQMLIDTATAMAALFTVEFKKQLDLAIAPTLSAMQTTGVQAQSAVDLSSRPDPARSPQRYAAWLASIGGIDPTRSPQSYAAAQTAVGSTYNVTINAGAIANKQELPQIIVDALGTYTKQSGAGGLTRVLGL